MNVHAPSGPLAQAEYVYAVWRTPFSDRRPMLHAYRPGCTIAEMVERTPGLPPDFMRRGEVLIGEYPILRRFWKRIRVKPGHKITLHYPLGNGGGKKGGGKNGILGLIVSIAALVASVFTLGGGLAFLGSAFAQGAIGAKLAAGAISLAGALAARALTPLPAQPKQKGQPDQKGPASLSGNVLGAGAPVPAVIGTRRIFPPLGAQPLIERVDGDEIVEAFFVLAGAHDLTEIRLGDAAIEDAEDVTCQIKYGHADDDPMDLIERYSLTVTPQIELSRHAVTPDDQQLLSDQEQPTRSLPKWHATRSSTTPPDEIWLHFSFVQGLYKSGSNDHWGVPLRIRMRASADDDWIYLPEIHYASNSTQEIRASVRLLWGDGPEVVPGISANEGWVAAYKHAAGDASPTSEDYDADASFSAGDGSDGLYQGAEASTNVRRVTLSRYEAVFYLDADAVPKGACQIEIKRGAAYHASDFSKSGHSYDGDDRDLFWYILSSGRAYAPESRENVADQVYLLRCASVVNEHPCPKGGLFAIIAIKAVNRSVDSLSVRASRYVRDWDGTGWNTLTTTSNPAPHLRDIWTGPLTPDPLPPSLIDEDSLVAWRQACIDEGYRCNLVVEGETLTDVENKVAGAGYALPRKSESWGVIRDRDRSADDPEQIFTQRNSRGLTMAKAFARLPDAVRAVWYDADLDDAEQQKIVYRPTLTDAQRANPRIEEIRYDAIDNEEDATARALFDLGQAELRAATWSFQAPAEALRATRGDLIGVNHDTLDRTHGSARIADVDIENGEDGPVVAGVWLDAAVPVWNEPGVFEITDWFAQEDVFTIGLVSSARIRRSDGSFSVHALSVVTGTRDHLVFATPVDVEEDDDGSPTVRPGNLVSVGEAGSEARRLIITAIKWDRGQVASIEAVDEAQELFAA
jgi:hypothetical protein